MDSDWLIPLLLISNSSDQRGTDSSSPTRTHRSATENIIITELETHLHVLKETGGQGLLVSNVLAAVTTLFCVQKKSFSIDDHAKLTMPKLPV